MHKGWLVEKRKEREDSILRIKNTRPRSEERKVWKDLQRVHYCIPGEGTWVFFFAQAWLCIWAIVSTYPSPTSFYFVS
jgi:hypothetical protein